MVEIYLININDDLTKDQCQDLHSKLTDCRKNKMQKYKFEVDAKRSLYPGILLSILLCANIVLQKMNLKWHIIYMESLI